MTNMHSKITDLTRKAIIDYNMINNEEGIMVGLSGGKDSLTLLKILADFKRRSKYKYPLAAGHIDLGNADNLDDLQKFCDDLGVPLFIEKTNIMEVVFDIREEKSPCSLCAKMRRGALNSLAKSKGYNKVALGHHLDDVIETLFLNMCFEGRIDSFKPVTWLSNQEITVIRPFIYVEEEHIIKFANKENLPIIKSCCPANGNTKREEMKNIVKDINKISPGARQRIIRSLKNMEISQWTSEKVK